MIGIKISNPEWLNALLNILGPEAEEYVPNHQYSVILTNETKFSAPVSVVCLGKDIGLPCSMAELKQKLVPEMCYENNCICWNSKSRTLFIKREQREIQLTEKESEMIGFLVAQPNHQATREELLQKVWHYTTGVETHTIESHIYALRQKLGPLADQVIQTEKNTYFLI